MEISDFFTFEVNATSSTFQASATALEKNKDGINDHDKLIQGMYDGINFPILFEQECGKKLLDVLGTGWSDLSLISDKMHAYRLDAQCS